MADRQGSGFSAPPPLQGYVPRGSQQHRYPDPGARHDMYSIESGSITGYVPSHHEHVNDQPRPSMQIVDDKDFKDNLPLSIFAMLCCCWPLGVLSFMNALDARRFHREGRFDKAYDAVIESKRFSAWSLGVGICLFLTTTMSVIIILSYTLR